MHISAEFLGGVNINRRGRSYQIDVPNIIGLGFGNRGPRLLGGAYTRLRDTGAYVSANAHIAMGVELGEGSIIGPYTDLREGVCVGTGSIIMRRVLLMSGTSVGNGTVVMHKTTIRQNTSVGNGVFIGDRVFVAPHVSIPDGSIINPRHNVTASMINGCAPGPLLLTEMRF